MTTIQLVDNFPHWQREARAALHNRVPPEEIIWQPAGEAQLALENCEEQKRIGAAMENSLSGEVAAPPEQVHVPPLFIRCAKNVACHKDPQRWAILYRVLWRLTHGEKHLLDIVTDDDVHRVYVMERAVRRDMHKMRAFVRFRAVEREAETHYVAWFEPDHYIVEANAPFFARRFASMLWSILTPQRCAHWNGETLFFTPGVAKSDAPTEDAIEKVWLTYYASIFNPARLKVKMMQTEMPRKYWRNLPEAALIEGLIRAAPARTGGMIRKEG